MNSVKKMVNIGERLKYIRETYDISGKELASLLGIEKSSISHYEKNDRTIPIEHLIKFSDHLKLSIDYIFGLTDIKNYEDHVEGVDINKMAKNIKKHDMVNDWSYEMSDEERIEYCEKQIEKAKIWEQECKIYGLKFYDTSKDRDKVLNEIMEDIEKNIKE